MACRSRWSSATPRPRPRLRRSTRRQAISSLDHVVVRTPDPERAIAFYAGRLGLDLRLDRSNSAWGARLLFFRCGDLVVEIVHDLKKGVSVGPDHLWGLSWRASDIAKVHARLKAAGVDVSAVRAGRRPGHRGGLRQQPHRRRAHHRDRRTEALVMRPALLALCLAAAGCAAAPPPPKAPATAVQSAAGLAPLGPCPAASSWKHEAPPPTASRKVSMVLLAVGEWARFRRQVVIYSSDAPPRTEQLGLKERDTPPARPTTTGRAPAIPSAAAPTTCRGRPPSSPGTSRVPGCRATSSAPTSATRSTSSAWSSGRAGRAPRSFPAPARRAAA